MTISGVRLLAMIMGMVLISVSVYSGDGVFKGRTLEGRKKQLSVDSTIVVSDTILSNSTLRQGWKVTGVSNVITLKVDEFSNLVLPDSFDITLKFRYTTTKWDYATGQPGSTVTTQQDSTLIIKYNKLRPYAGRSVLVIPGVFSSSVKVISVSPYDTASNVYKSLLLESEISTSREYSSFDCTNNAVQAISYTDRLTDRGELEVWWAPVLQADEYDLEWAYVDSSALSNYYVNNAYDGKKIFDNNATRVSIKTERYLIPLLYDSKGKLFFRVRSVQVKNTGQRLEATWSSAYSNGLGSYDYTGHERLLNWQANSTFAEEGKRKSVIQYFDGSLRNRQTVTKDNTTDTTIVAETFYDNQGRGVIQVLPTPSLSSIIKYTPNFNTAVNGAEYDKSRYDPVLSGGSGYCGTGAEKMSESNGAARYYSQQNPNKNNGFNKYIPEAKGYPFTEVKYMQDNTGQISAQGGVGPYHQLYQTDASDATTKDHETKYYYGTADQEDLDALFGTEAGVFSHYFKNMVRDANGQYSVSYVDMHGRTVATALAGIPGNASLGLLPSNISATVTKKLLDSNNNIVRGNLIESSRSLVVTKNGLHKFKYTLSPESLKLANCAADTICYDCAYNLRITITDDCNNQKLPSQQPYVLSKSNFTLTQPDTTCTPAVAFADSFEISLQEGVYAVTKQLEISSYAADYYRDSIYLRNNTCKTLDQFIAEQKQLVLQSLSCAAPTCQACTDSLGTWEQYRTKYMQKAAITPADSASYRAAALASYTADAQDCKLLCNKQTELDDIRTSMLADVTAPSGQYADDAAAPLKDRDYYSIFNTAGGQSDTKLRYREGVYSNVDGTPSLVGGINAKDLDEQTFSNNFQAPWAQSLLRYHPEYGRYERLRRLTPSLDWETAYRNTETFSEAYAKGYLNPTGNTSSPFSRYPVVTANVDALFKNEQDSLQTTMFKSALESYMLNLTGNGQNVVSIWATATIAATCKTGNCPATYKDNQHSFDTSGSYGLCKAELDAAWVSFRELYLSKRRQLTDGYVFGAAVSPAPSAGHVLYFHDGRAITEQGMKDEVATEQANNNISTGGSICEGYVSQWWQELAPCGYTQADYDILKPRLIEVCRQGTDAANPYGSSSVAPSSTYQYKSFEDVIRQYNLTRSPAIPYGTKCNAELISAPLPYNQKPPMYETKITSTPDSCSCSTITQLYSQFLQEGYEPLFSAYVKKKTGADMSEANLTTLRQMCTDTAYCNFIETPITLPAALQCGVKDACVSCVQVKTMYDSFMVRFPSVTLQSNSTDSLQAANNHLFESFMNHRLGFGKTTQDYLAFMDTCGITRSTGYTAGAICDSLMAVSRSFDSIYAAKRNGQVYQNVKISSAAQIMVESANALIHARQTPTNPIVPAPFAYVTPRNTNFTAKFKSVYRTGTRDSSFNVIVPLPLQYSPGMVNALNLFNNIVLPQDYINSNPTQEELKNKYCATVLRVGANQFLNQWTKQYAIAEYNYYATSTPMNKYLADTNYSSLESNIYSFTFYPLPDTIVTPAQYYNYHTTKIYSGGAYTTNALLTSQIKDISNLRFAPEFMSSSTLAKDKASGMRVTIKLSNDSIINGYVYNGAASASYITWKETVDSNLYSDDCRKAFTYYFNLRKGTNYTFKQLDSLYYASCSIKLQMCGETPLLCGKTVPVFAVAALRDVSPCRDSTDFAVMKGTQLYDFYRDSLSDNFKRQYNKKCINARNLESFTVTAPVSEYHYTLYYYGQAGNLIATVPPEGVDISKFADANWSATVALARRNNQLLTPAHKMKTVYLYNSQNQVMAQASPDGGQSMFWYDRVGRLAVSQNENQKFASATELNKKYSYTLYDAIGRITEVGEYQNPSSTPMTDNVSRQPALLQSWLSTTANRSQITSTYYDAEYAGWAVGNKLLEAKNLRNRVAYTTITLGNNPANYNQATFYSYDIHGNVDTLIQDYGSSLMTATNNMMSNNGNRWKKIVYRYDLISGKVNHVAYQPQYISKADNKRYVPNDAMYHKYEYDAENRITAVYTSTDSVIWEKDVRYQYYKHGPLARMILGDQQVQGVDYAYTLQGWLKGVNSTGLKETVDMGNDGNTATGASQNQYIAKDVVGYNLNYYKGDYSVINPNINTTAALKPFPETNIALGSAYSPLFNGNISGMAVNVKNLTKPGGGVGAVLYNYKYDQLNRLINFDAYIGFTTGNIWPATQQTPRNEYKERITYDGNGNILKYFRNGNLTATMLMDSLNYKYKPGTNMLDHVRDSVPAGTYTSSNYEDIDGQVPGNFAYDSIGNLIKDSSEKITNISWNVYGKITAVNYSNTTAGKLKNLYYYYDAAGNRIGKRVENVGTPTTNTYTWYVRDASGNVMATYTSTALGTAVPATLNISERHLYGSSKVGIYNLASDVKTMNSYDVTSPYNTSFTRGNKYYELSNHLGNVLATISDKKLGHTAANNTVDYYDAEIISASDYAPFGSGLPGRTSNTGAYRYAFNGKEKDKDGDGQSIQYDYGARIYDPHLGRFKSVDPMARSYSGETNYSFAGNSPIQYTDFNGYFKISPLFAKRYPTLARVIEFYLPLLKDNPKAKEGWIETIGFNNHSEGAKAFDDMVSNGKGPWIDPTRPEGEQNDQSRRDLSGFFEPSGMAGEWQGTRGFPNNITISSFYLDRLESAIKIGNNDEIGQQMFVISVLIMHESAHWGKWRYNFHEGLGDRYEAGANFEFNTFGTRFSYQSPNKRGFDENKVKSYYNTQKGAYGTTSFGFSLNQSSSYWNRIKKYPVQMGKKGDPSLKENNDPEPNSDQGSATTNKDRNYSYDY